MKAFITGLMAIFFIGNAMAQPSLESQGVKPAKMVLWQYQSSQDTIPVWIVYLDSVRMFAAYPTYDVRVDVQEGYLVRSEAFNIEDRYFDINGVELSEDIVLFAKRRKPVKRAFRDE